MSLSLKSITPGLTDRAMLVGQTGCGKTTLAEYLLSDRRYVVALDGKGLLSWKGYQKLTTLQNVVKSKAERIIYAPNAKELSDEEYINGFFKWVYDRFNTTVYIDEVYSIVSNEKMPEYYHASLTRGRERGVSVFSSTQRPKDIPQVIMSESEFFYIFRLSLPQDRKKMTEIVPIKDSQISDLQKRQFYFATSDGNVRGALTLKIK